MFMKIKSLIALFFFPFLINAQQVEWQSFEDIGEKFQKIQKPIAIWVYADDVDSCKMMNEQTFENKEVTDYLNILFYNIKLDAKSSEKVTFFNGQTFGKNEGEEFNEISKFLLNNDVRLPAMVIFNEKAEGQVFYGFKDRDHIFPILIYYAEKVYEAYDYSTFEKSYFEAYPVGQKQIMTRLNIRWKTMEEVLELQKNEPRKILIDLYNNYSISATMMRTNSFNDPELAKYLNEKYYCTTVDYKSDIEFELKGITYKKSTESHGYHEFVVAVLLGKMKFPAFIILDEDFNLLERQQRYFTTEEIEPILKYFGDNIYKQKTFEEYQKE